MSRHFVLRVMLALVLLMGLMSNLVFAGGPEFDAIAAAADKFANSGKAMIITADKLYENLNDGDKANDPFIVDIRAAADYAKGYIPGAVNIPFATLFKAENLAKLPKDKQIVLYCYTGHACSMAAFSLGTMGYNALALKWSMMGWTKDNTLRVAPFGSAADPGRDYKVETTANTFSGSFTTPTLNTGKSDVAAMIAASADAYLSAGKATLVTADKLFENLNDGDKANDPVIIDTRKPEDYAKGHVPGSVNVELKDLFKAATLAKLPTNKQIVVVCYTGHNSSMASFMLDVLGYNAVTLKWGIMGWTKDTNVAPMRFGVGADAEKDYKVEKPATALPKTGEAAPLFPIALAFGGLIALLTGLRLRRTVKA